MTKKKTRSSATRSAAPRSTSPPAVPLTEYAARRNRLRSALKGAIGVVFAGEHQSHLPVPWRPHAHFEYLTGVTDEPGAGLVLDPAGPVESRRDMLFLRRFR